MPRAGILADMIGRPETDKVFAYVTRITDGRHELLVFESLDEPGIEVPKGAVEEQETLTEAVLRELFEEAGLTEARIVRPLGTADWNDERQHFFLVEAPAGVPDAFTHVITGDGVDAGLRYQYHWVPIEAQLGDRLVQGCGRFVEALRTAGNA